MIKFDRLPGGKRFALTLSYDDGRDCDRRLIEIMNKYGIRGTFHINSSRVDSGPWVASSDDIKNLYKNHEVSCHGVYHHSLHTLSPQNIIGEILEDRKFFENLTGTPVRGMSYANGSYNDEIITVLRNCGMVYSRTTKSTRGFLFPDDFMQWHPTCHHRDCLEDAEKFLALTERAYFAHPYLFYVWGHSYEFDNDNNWDVIEKFCELMGGRDDIWYATNNEIYEYINAQKSLIISVDNKIVRNPTDIPVWFSEKGFERDTKCYCVNPGETIKLD